MQFQQLVAHFALVVWIAPSVFATSASKERKDKAASGKRIIEALPWMDHPDATQKEYISVSPASSGGKSPDKSSSSSLWEEGRTLHPPPEPMGIPSYDSTHHYHPSTSHSYDHQSTAVPHSQHVSHAEIPAGSIFSPAGHAPHSPSTSQMASRQKLQGMDYILTDRELSQPLTPQQMELALDCLSHYQGKILTSRQRITVRQRLKRYGFPIIKRNLLPSIKTIQRQEQQNDKEEDFVVFQIGRKYDNAIFHLNELPPVLTRSQMNLVEETIQMYPSGNKVTRDQRLYARSKLKHAGLPLKYRMTIEEKIQRKEKRLPKDTIKGKAKGSQKRTATSLPLDDSGLSSEGTSLDTAHRIYSRPTAKRGPPAPPGMNHETYHRLYVSPEDQSKLNIAQKVALDELYRKHPLDQPLLHSSSQIRRELSNEIHKLRAMGVPLPAPKKGLIPLPKEELEGVIRYRSEYDRDRYSRLKGSRTEAASTSQDGSSKSSCSRHS